MKSAKYFDYVYVLLTILLTVYGQLVLKWRMNMKGQLPSPFSEKVRFMFNAYLDPWVLSGFGVAFLASITWAMAMTKLQLSQAYPFMSLSYIFIFFMSVLIFKESVTAFKIGGYLLIIAGIVLLSFSKDS
jgi:multidrug transporter EmrE-like cation transporter